MDTLRQDLTFPITLELFDDPVIVPCCGKGFSSAALLQCQSQQCPADFDVLGAVKNINLAGMVESLKQEEKKQQQKHRWECSLIPLHNDIGELKLSLFNAMFEMKQSLFILVVDQGGSMSGKLWKQVHYSPFAVKKT